MPVDDDLIRILERMIRGLSGEWLEKARRFRPVSEVPIGELMTHPDLGDRLGEVVRDLPGVEFGVYYRLFAARLSGGKVFALAQGTHTIRFRVDDGAVALGGVEGLERDVEFGRDWIKANAWNPDIPTARWKDILRDLAARARAFTASV
ncbi:MAG TPA: hypothetical protein VHL99_03640 [Candidatus Binatia bacterium]|nr:hypothetical protein [Candidatus Binatia bacterium]